MGYSPEGLNPKGLGLTQNGLLEEGLNPRGFGLTQNGLLPKGLNPKGFRAYPKWVTCSGVATPFRGRPGAFAPKGGSEATL